MNPTFLQSINFEILIKLLDTLIWPVTLLIIILLFRKNFQNAFDRLGSIKADASGIAITFDKQLEATQKLFEKIKPKVISKSAASIKTLANRDGSPYNQVLNVRNDIIHFLITKSKALDLDVNLQLPNQMCTQLLSHNAVNTDQAQMLEALLNLTATANENTTQEQANAVHQLFNQTGI